MSTSAQAGAIIEFSKFSRGDVAQLGEHLVRNEKVGGSSPLISTRMCGISPRSQLGQARCDTGALTPSGLESSSGTLTLVSAPSSLALFQIRFQVAMRCG